jgi:hypothetical protein
VLFPIVGERPGCISQRRRLQARNLRNGLWKLTKHRPDLIRRFLHYGRRKSQIETQDVLRIETPIHAPEVREAAKRQARAGQEHDRERQLRHYENGLYAMPRSARAAPAFLQSRMQVRGRGLQSGREAEEHSSKDGDGQYEGLIVGNAGGVGRSATRV